MHNLPRPPAAVFVGRQEALARLEAGLTSGDSVVVTQAVVGLGGVGKSELALQYAHARRRDYQLTWWLTAEDTAQVEAGVAAMAGWLCPELALAATTAEAAAWAVAWLQAHPGWLLILDNVTDPADVEPLLGQLHGGHMLVTTRRDAGWQQAAVPVRLGVLDPCPAAALLTAVTGQDGPGDAETAAAIAAELGFLPLALDQAAAYITQNQIPLSRYLNLLGAHPARMRAAGAAGGQAQRTIARLWDVTLAAIGMTDAGAAGLLRVLACYAPDAIPRSLIGGSDPGPEVDEALGLLASYSMITLTGETVSMHRLVQAVILDAPEPPAAERPQDIALAWLARTLPPDPYRNVAAWPALRTLVPHAEAIASRYTTREEPAALSQVLHEIGVFHQSQGAWDDALRLISAATAIAQRILGPSHPDTARRLGDLACTCSDLGRHAEALPLAQRALMVSEATLGPDHPDIARRLLDLARACSELGRHAEALPLAQRALAVSEAALGPDHPDTAVRLGFLASTYSDLGRHAEALPLAQRALAVSEAALGPDHPDTAWYLVDLARAYSDLGRHAEALPLAQRATAVSEAALGPDHPVTAWHLGYLVRAYSDLGRHAEALPLAQRALAVSEAALGPDHPDTARSLDNLARAYSDLGRHAEALPLAQRATAVSEATLGPDHPDTVVRLDNLSAFYHAGGRHAEAAALEQHVPEPPLRSGPSQFRAPRPRSPEDA